MCHRPLRISFADSLLVQHEMSDSEQDGKRKKRSPAVEHEAQPPGILTLAARGRTTRDALIAAWARRDTRSSRQHATGPSPLLPSPDSNRHRYSREQELNLPPWGLAVSNHLSRHAADTTRPFHRSPRQMRSARRHPMSRECSWLLHDYSNSALGDTGCASVSGVQLQTIMGHRARCESHDAEAGSSHRGVPGPPSRPTPGSAALSPMSSDQHSC